VRYSTAWYLHKRLRHARLGVTPAISLAPQTAKPHTPAVIVEAGDVYDGAGAIMDAEQRVSLPLARYGPFPIGFETLLADNSNHLPQPQGIATRGAKIDECQNTMKWGR